MEQLSVNQYNKSVASVMLCSFSKYKKSSSLLHKEELTQNFQKVSSAILFDNLPAILENIKNCIQLKTQKANSKSTSLTYKLCLLRTNSL
jgi:hypothetical protein